MNIIFKGLKLSVKGYEEEAISLRDFTEKKQMRPIKIHETFIRVSKSCVYL